MIKRMGNITGKTAIILAVMALVLYAADDAKMKLTDSAGVSSFAVQDSTGASVFRINSDGNVTLGDWQGTAIAIANGGTGAGDAATARTNLGLGNVENTALTTWIGSTNLRTLGSISTGIWNGTAITQTYLSIGTNAGDTSILTLHDFISIAPGLNQIPKWNGTNWAPADDVGASGFITSLGGQTGATQTFANDTNVTISSASNTHTLGWTSTLAVGRGGTGAGTFTAGYLKANGTNAFTTLATIPNTDGGTGLNTSGSTGVPSISAGTWSVNATLGLTLGGTGQTTANAAFNALAPTQTGNAGKFLITDATNTSWGTSVSGAIINLNASSNFATNINTGTSTGIVSIGSTTGVAGILERVGTGNYSLDGVAGSTYAMGASTTTGTITIGGTAQTGALTLGSSSGAQTVNVGTGTGNTGTINIGTGAAGVKTVHIADAAALANVITIGDNQATAATIPVGSAKIAGANVVVNGALNFGTTGGAAQAQTLTLTPAITGPATGQMVCFKAGFSNTGAAPTLNVNGTVAKTVVKRASTALVAGDIAVGGFYIVIYGGTNWQLINPTVP